jgi:hypothetical protein
MLTSEDHRRFIEEINLDEVAELMEEDAPSYQYDAFQYLRQFRTDVLQSLMKAIQFKKPMMITLSDILLAAGVVKESDLDAVMGTPGLTKVVAAQRSLVENYEEPTDAE